MVFISKDTEEKFHHFCVDFPHEVWKSRLCDRGDSECWRVPVLAISELCVSSFGTFFLALSEASDSMIQGLLAVNWSCQQEVVVYVWKI